PDRGHSLTPPPRSVGCATFVACTCSSEQGTCSTARRGAPATDGCRGQRHRRDGPRPGGVDRAAGTPYSSRRGESEDRHLVLNSVHRGAGTLSLRRAEGHEPVDRGTLATRAGGVGTGSL